MNQNEIPFTDELHSTMVEYYQTGNSRLINRIYPKLKKYIQDNQHSFDSGVRYDDDVFSFTWLQVLNYNFNTNFRFYTWFYYIYRSQYFKWVSRKPNQMVRNTQNETELLTDELNPYKEALVQGDDDYVAVYHTKQNVTKTDLAYIYIHQMDLKMLQLRYIKGLKPKEISEYLDLNYGKVKNQLTNEKQRLRERLGNLYPDLFIN